MLYEEIPTRAVLFHFGEFGSKFYVILRGQVAVLLLKSPEEIKLAKEREE